MAHDLTDDYVASILTRDAKAKSKEYAFVGLGAYLPSRPTAHAPKPNTRFLRNILKEMDNHNTALREKEEREARERRRNARRNRLGSERAVSPRREIERYDVRSKKRRRDETDHREKQMRRRADSRERSEGHRSARNRNGRSERRKAGESLDDEGGTAAVGSKLHRHHTLRGTRHREVASDSDMDEHRSRKSHRERGQRSCNTSRARRRLESRSNSPEQRGDSLRSPKRRIALTEPESHERRHSKKRKPHSTDHHRNHSDSDPLEALVGPLPTSPNREPQTRRRGRGAHTSASAMDARFSASYDAIADVQPESDEEVDDWGLALEAVRDSAKWKSQGADRLRAAGFTEDEVAKWEKSGKEKGEDDVRWAKRGEGREWDRGKTVDNETGDVEIKPEWGRLNRG